MSFKFFQKNNGWTFDTKVKHITFTNRLRKKRVSILRFANIPLNYYEAREYCGSFYRFLENYDENNVIVEKIYYLKSRKKWNGMDQININRFTHINLLPRIGVNDYVQIRYKLIDETV